MKRNVLTITSILVIGSGVVITDGCKKNDSTPPAITVIGASTINISLNSTYTDPGATATDNVDGMDVVTSDFSPVNPNVNLAGTYIIHYNALDNAGNSDSAKRTVIVSNDAKNVAGPYNVSDVITGNNKGAYTYLVVVTASTTLNNQLFLTNFSGLGSNVTTTAMVSGNTITLSPVAQQPANMRDPGTINGTGTVVADTAITGLHYMITYNSGGSDTGVSTWTKFN